MAPGRRPPPKGKGQKSGGKGGDALYRDLLARMEACPTAESLNDKVIIPFVEALESVCTARGYVLNIYGDTANLVFTGDSDAAIELYNIVDDYLTERGEG